MEKFFWADQIADRIIKERPRKNYICASGITPSGTVHIGNFREVITTEMVVRALKDKGKKVKFIYSWDDYDRFRKVPENVPDEKKEEYEKYLGMAVSDIPSPFGDGKSYAKHFEGEFEKSLEKVGIKPYFIRQNEMYKKCKYASLIKKAIDERKEIMKILDKYREEPLEEDWFPIEIYCEKCKKDAAKIKAVKGYEIEYSCECGFSGKFDFRKKGIVKLKWRVDWPMRWSYEGVDFEPGGNDHSVHGGSYMTGKEIAKKIFDFEAPLYVMYDFISVKGSKDKISSSKGNALTLDEVEKVYEPNVLRYLFTGTRPNRGFQISFDNDVIKIYEDFDSLERKYYNGKASSQEKRMYEMSVLKLGKKMPKKTSFRHLITLVQVGKTKGLSKEDKIRAEKVANWLDLYAGDEMKFKVQEKINDDVFLSDLQKKSLEELRFLLESREFDEDSLYNEFYNICKATGIKNEDFFTAAYNVILNKNKGPRLASLILAIGREKIIKLLKQIK